MLKSHRCEDLNQLRVRPWHIRLWLIMVQPQPHSKRNLLEAKEIKGEAAENKRAKNIEEQGREGKTKGSKEKSMGEEKGKRGLGKGVRGKNR